jgi:hypothetical protein
LFTIVGAWYPEYERVKMDSVYWLQDASLSHVKLGRLEMKDLCRNKQCEMNNGELSEIKFNINSIRMIVSMASLPGKQ